MKHLTTPAPIEPPLYNWCHLRQISRYKITVSEKHPPVSDHIHIIPYTNLVIQCNRERENRLFPSNNTRRIWGGKNTMTARRMTTQTLGKSVWAFHGHLLNPLHVPAN